MSEQLEMDIPTVTGPYHVSFRKGALHGTEEITRAVVQDADQLVGIVEGYRQHAVLADQVNWNHDTVPGGFLTGLAPGGVVYEISIDPPITVEA